MPRRPVGPVNPGRVVRCKEMPKPRPPVTAPPSSLLRPPEPSMPKTEKKEKEKKIKKKEKVEKKAVPKQAVFEEEGEEEIEVEDDDPTDARYGPGGKRRHPDDDQDDEDWGSKWKNPRSSYSVRGVGYAVP